jgi:hypothetical protein
MGWSDSFGYKHPNVELNVSVNFLLEELSTFSREQTEAFMRGIAEVLSVNSCSEEAEQEPDSQP